MFEVTKSNEIVNEVTHMGRMRGKLKCFDSFGKVHASVHPKPSFSMMVIETWIRFWCYIKAYFK